MLCAAVTLDGAGRAQLPFSPVPRPRGDEPAPGRLLVAARGLPDPNFARALVLLVDHNAEGAMGLVVNEPTQMPLARLFKGLTIPGGEDVPAFLGGPVQAPGVLALIRSRTPVEGARHVVGDVHIVQSAELMREWLTRESDPARVRVFLGYSGWGPGQLEREWEAGTWHVLDADADVVFDAEPDTAWDRQIRRTDVRRASR